MDEILIIDELLEKFFPLFKTLIKSKTDVKFTFIHLFQVSILCFSKDVFHPLRFESPTKAALFITKSIFLFSFDILENIFFLSFSFSKLHL